MATEETQFKMSQVVFDMENKEYVKISNGIEHDGKLQPTEAMAVRFIGFDKNKKPILAYTYRKVKQEFLRAVKEEKPDAFDRFFNVCQEKPEHVDYIGRI